MATPPTLTYSSATWTDSSLSNTTGSLSWNAGDIVVVFGGTAGDATTLATPTATGLSFSLLASVATGTNRAYAYLWSATAAGSGSGAISCTANNLTNRSGIGAFVDSGSDGLGTPVTLAASSAKTISVTRAQANSAVAVLLLDWNAVADATTDPTTGNGGAGAERTEVAGDASTWAVYLYSWPDEGATGTTAYGVTNHTGTVTMSGIAVEIKGAAGGGGGTTRGTPFDNRGTAFNGGRTLQGPLMSREQMLWHEAARLARQNEYLRAA